MAQVSNRFFVTSIKDGTVVTAVVYSDKPLSQLVDKATGDSDPDWTIDGNRPTVWCVTRAGSTVKTPQSKLSSNYMAEWYLNGTRITFSSATAGSISTSHSGAFQIVSKSVDGVSVPALKILKNIITVQNNDNDVLTCEGCVEYNGAQIDFSVSTTIRMSTLSGSGYYGWIEGDPYVTAQTGAAGTATMEARLKTGSGSVANFKTKWYMEPSTTAFATVSAVGGVATTSITGSQFTDWVVIRCDFFKSDDTVMSEGTRLYSAYWDVDDMEDEEEMYIASYVVDNVRGGLDVSLRSNQTAQFVVWMGKRGDQTKVDTRYTSFKCRIMNSDGVTQTSFSGSGITTGSGSLTVTDGYLNITKSTGITTPVTAAKAGTITIPATYVDTQNGRITGLVVATTS